MEAKKPGMKTYVMRNEADFKNFNFTALELMDDKYIQVTTTKSKGKSSLRVYYMNNKDEGYFYHNDIRYRIPNIRNVVSKKFYKADDEEVVEAAGGFRTKEITLNTPVKKAPFDPNAKPKHPQHDTIKTCIDQDIPVYLVGEAGTGKNHTLQEIAEELGMDFYFTNSIQQEYKVTGFIDAGGVYHETEFYKAFLNGGVFFLDEMDASIPEVLVLLNAAIANRYFEFPNGKVNAHPDFRVVAAGNTVGNGANELYTGRLVLDSATLDRFVVIEFDYCREIEMALAKGNSTLVNFIRGLRNFCKTNGIRGTFSYRMITAVTKLEATGMPIATIIKIAVVKGLDQDTIRTLKVENAGTYYYGLKEVQGL